MEFLQFIFSDFWVWLGFVILVSVIGGGVVELVKACKRNRKVTVVRTGTSIHATIENVARNEVQDAVISAIYVPDREENECGGKDGREGAVMHR